MLKCQQSLAFLTFISMINTTSDHTGKCIRRFGGIFKSVLPVLHRPEVADIGVNTI